MKSQCHVVIGGLVQIQCAFFDQVMGEFANVLRHRVTGIQEIEWPGQTAARLKCRFLYFFECQIVPLWLYLKYWVGGVS